MYLSIIILPLLGSIVSGFFGRKVGVKGAQLITCASVIITTILSIISFFEMGFNNIPVTLNLFRWIDSEWFNIIWGFQYDSLTVSMLIPVLIISSLVHIYSISYMSNDPHNQRFFSYLSLFTFMMIILVTANNYLLMFVGWEGVGVCSYLLVSFWFTRIAANQSSISAFLTNRVGDCFLTIGMFAILWSLGNLDYATVFSLAPYINTNVVLIIGVCLLIGAMAKSSQVGLHVWLPMAMEGPTPVSALIHAATMVTAGVYLLMRSSPLIEYSSTVLLLCLWLGAITTVFSSLIGLFQQDIKKVIAYSTMSQLGMMVIAIGLSSYNVALFHLINHAFYKALLFLGAGSVIHAVADNQDFRKFGGLRNYLPLTYSVMLIASLSLVAFPFMTGFYSKDFILESAYGQFSFSGVAVYIIATIGAIFTTLYSVKVLYLTFLANPNGPRTYYRLATDNLFSAQPHPISYKPAHEGDFFLTLPLVILALFSIFFGFITKDIFIGLGSNFFVDNSLFIHPIHEIMIDTEFAVPVLFKLLPFIFTISFSIIALTLSELLSELVIYFKLSRFGYNIFGFFNQRFLIEFFYNKYITNLILDLGGQMTKILDKGSIELFGPFGLERGLVRLSKNISSLSTSHVTTYALYILVGFILYLFYNNLPFDNLCLFLITILLIMIGNGESEKGAAIPNYGHYARNNNKLMGNRTYIHFNKKMFSTSAAFLLNRREFDDLVSKPHADTAAELARQDLIARQDARENLGERYRSVNTSHTRAQDHDNEKMENFHETRLVTATDKYNKADDAVIEAREAFANAAGVTAPTQAPREAHLPCNPRVEEEEDTGAPAAAPSTNNPDGEDEGGEGGSEGGEGGNEGGGSENSSGNDNSSSGNGGLSKVIDSPNWDENLAPEDVEDSLNGDENLAPGDVEDLIETLRENYHMAHMSTPEMVETDGFWSSLLDLI
jgi:NADH-ubiquinone oxidoreductase chain 5